MLWPGTMGAFISRRGARSLIVRETSNATRCQESSLSKNLSRLAITCRSMSFKDLASGKRGAASSGESSLVLGAHVTVGAAGAGATGMAGAGGEPCKLFRGKLPLDVHPAAEHAGACCPPIVGSGSRGTEPPAPLRPTPPPAGGRRAAASRPAPPPAGGRRAAASRPAPASAGPPLLRRDSSPLAGGGRSKAARTALGRTCGAQW
mmetsp:Transcript_113196/g.354019  ORF Transcript_113196/g.354019 Transcript_113196/m.354019 type:complete len:205 (+) Transcript_113196:35-649(+)